MTFSEAAPHVQLLTIVFLAVAAAALVLWVQGLRRLRRSPGEPLPRTLAFLNAWRVGGPLLAIAQASLNGTEFFVAVYAYPPVARYQDYAPGLSEISMVLWAGFLAGGVAALTYANLRGRVAEAQLHPLH